jgi:hypothetical protein
MHGVVCSAPRVPVMSVVPHVFVVQPLAAYPVSRAPDCAFSCHGSFLSAASTCVAKSRHKTTVVTPGTTKATTHEHGSERLVLSKQATGQRPFRLNMQSPPRRVESAAKEQGAQLKWQLNDFYRMYNPAGLARVEAIVADFVSRGGGAKELEELNKELIEVRAYHPIFFWGRIQPIPCSLLTHAHVVSSLSGIRQGPARCTTRDETDVLSFGYAK